MKAVATEPQPSLGNLHVAGELIDGKYRLERVLGAGAMGRVWLARNVMLDLPVAIKIVDMEHHGRDAMARVLTEARLLAQLSHPNVVRVLDCHSDHSAAFVVMELLEGCTLAELMEEGALPAALVVRIAVPLLDALATAHRAGIVHRDIKPENIYVARRGQRICPKLLDFGIARSGPAGLSPKDKRLVVGTPGYMSPEQAWGEEAVDHRADIWAMGVVMYEAISGHSAFQCSSYSHYLRALRERELPPLLGQDSAALWAVLQRAMSRASEDRFVSASEFGATLRLWLRARGLQEDLSGDSLPEHWGVPGSAVHRAFCRSATRASLSTEHGSDRSSALPGSLTMLDPRTDPQNATWPDTELTRIAPDAAGRRQRPVVAWAAVVASAVCGTIALLHARADAGLSAHSMLLGVRPDLHAHPQPLRAAHARVAPHSSSVQRHDRSAGMSTQRTRSRGVNQFTSAQRKARRRAPTAHSAAHALRDTLRAQARQLGLKSPW